MDILTLFSCFETLLTKTSRRQLVIISNAVLTMLVKFFETHLFDGSGDYILVGDETVVSEKINVKKQAARTRDLVFERCRIKPEKADGLLQFEISDRV